MRILVCNERFLFRFGVDRCLLMLGNQWRKDGHEIIMMGNRMDPASVSKCSDRFIRIPDAPDYRTWNEYTLDYLREHWDEWFNESNRPDAALVAGWPFYLCIPFLREKCGCVVAHDHGAVPVKGMSGPNLENQKRLRQLRKETLCQANKIIAVSRFLEETQSKPDTKGKVPTTCVLNGVDHIAGRLWANEELDLQDNHVVEEVRALKEAGMRILFQPGRWENGNYKNCAATVQLSKALAEKDIDHRILVLADEKSLETVPEDIRRNYLCTGFVDDETMKQLMELSDVGIIPSLWEGFDLPLGEMQFLGTKTFALDIGAHPEVVVDPYFLCRDMGEMTEKVIRELGGGQAFDADRFRQLCEQYRREFTWENRAKQMMDEIQESVRSAFVLYVDVTNACRDTANGGIMRVTRKLSRHLQERVNTVFVLWDDSIGQFVLPTKQEIDTLSRFDGPDPKKILYRSGSEQDRTKMGDILQRLPAGPGNLLVIETAQYRMLECAIPWLHDHGISVSAVFHDAIPVLYPQFCNDEILANHRGYMLCLAEMDSVMPTAEHNGTDLTEYWAQNGIETGTRVRAVGLAAEIDGMPRKQQKAERMPANKQILFVSTLEPRKNHIRFLEALEVLFAAHPELEKTTSVHLVGKRYEEREEIPAFVEAFCADHRNVKWLGVVDDATLRAEYTACTFTAYPSEVEGFGMPIIESLWAGKPCLCSRDGSIGELAAAGGCCLTDVTDRKAMADALYKMLTDEEYLVRLQHEATERTIRGWAEYADEMADWLRGLPRYTPDPARGRIPGRILCEISRMRANHTGRRMVTVSHLYPPGVIGGAEIIAHHQLRAMQGDGLATSIVLSLDVDGKHVPGTIYGETVDGVKVIRICRDITCMEQRGICFFDPMVNEVFRELCEAWEPEVVQFHHVTGMSMGMVEIARQYKAKTVFTLHDNWGFCYKNTRLMENGRLCSDVTACENCRGMFESDGMQVPMGVRKSYYRHVFEKADAFVSPSAYLARAYIAAGFDAHKMHVVKNGIDYASYAKLEKVPGKQFRITYAGVFGPHKGVDVLIRAAALTEGLSILINLVGKGDEEPYYRKLIEELGLTGKIVFRGKLSNEEMRGIYRETDLFCLPALSPENQPVTITEAMSCGIPVIASDVGGVKELVEDGVTGYLVEAGNAEDLAAKIRLLCNDPDACERMGETGKQRMADNDFHCHARNMAELFDRIRPAKPVKGRKILLVKGKKLPLYMDRMTRYDVIPMDWIVDGEDYARTEAVLVPDGETLTDAEKETVERYQLQVINTIDRIS